MTDCRTLLNRLEAGEYDDRLARAYCCAGDREATEYARMRISRVVSGWLNAFHPSKEAEIGIFSGPGRTELGGNHTDHQRGRVLGSAVNLDALACAAPNGTDTIRILSEGYPLIEILLNDLAPREDEKGTSPALVRGVAARIAALGHPLCGFDAYCTSNVRAGAGLSSSAAYEVLLGTMMNELCCGGALSDTQIAQIGQYAENVYFGKPCGLLDQMCSAVGGAVAIDFKDPANPAVERLNFDLTAAGYALCIIDSGASHADLTDEYAAVPAECKAVAAHFGKEFLREVDESAFWADLAGARTAAGDRAVLRAIHFFAEDKRAAAEADALRAGDLERFFALANASGTSSFQYLQNVYSCKTPETQPVSVSLALAEHLLEGAGAHRVHGGGFAGTIQAFVPLSKLEGFRSAVEAVLGENSCHVLSIRPFGGVQLI